MEYCICPKYIDENNAERENGSATNVTLSLPTKKSIYSRYEDSKQMRIGIETYHILGYVSTVTGLTMKSVLDTFVDFAMTHLELVDKPIYTSFIRSFKEDE